MGETPDTLEALNQFREELERERQNRVQALKAEIGLEAIEAAKLHITPKVENIASRTKRRSKNPDTADIDLQHFEDFTHKVKRKLHWYKPIEATKTKKTLTRYAQLLQAEAQLQQTFLETIERDAALASIQAQITQIQDKIDSHPDTIHALRLEAKQRNLARAADFLLNPDQFLKTNFNHLITLYTGKNIDASALQAQVKLILDVVEEAAKSDLANERVSSAIEHLSSTLTDRTATNTFYIEGHIMDMELYEHTNKAMYDNEKNQKEQRERENTAILQIQQALTEALLHQQSITAAADTSTSSYSASSQAPSAVLTETQTPHKRGRKDRSPEQSDTESQHSERKPHHKRHRTKATKHKAHDADTSIEQDKPASIADAVPVQTDAPKVNGSLAVQPIANQFHQAQQREDQKIHSLIRQYQGYIDKSETNECATYRKHRGRGTVQR